MKILITGATGFIGNRLAQKLVASGHEVNALVRNPAESAFHEGIRIHKGDITDLQAVNAAIDGCTQVYHIAGYAKLWARQRQTFYDINVTGTSNILKAAHQHGVRKLVYTSSCAVFGPSLKTALKESDPRITAYDHDYDLSKQLAENVVREYCKKGLEAVIVNPSRVYGPGPVTQANMITKMLINCLKGRPVLMPGIPHVVGNYAYVEDVVDGHLLAMEKGAGGEKYIVGGENLTYSEVINIVREEVGTAKLLPLPASAVHVWGYFQLLKHKITGATPAFTPSAARRYLQNAAFDCSKAINDLGYQITSFRTGIQKTIEYIRLSS
ncbi:MAG: NAD-dependent epimerase/dehydratase family protein [Chitinophagaceae bacterium]|nr:MAG: NAD-dependent epimerase/dehydratase family protein [Chitinophagaceae bacterium]